MSAADYLPAPARPPHDPFRLPLDHRAGWRIDADLIDNVEVSPLDGALVLASAPGSGRQLNEPGGSFGGLTTPSHVAIAADGSLFLLDWESGALKRFDPCECLFERVPCIGGLGSRPRQILQGLPAADEEDETEASGENPTTFPGIGICGGNLFVADPGNRRLQVFGLNGFPLRALWSPPTGEIDQPWRPVDVTFDSRGDVLVADPENGCVHVFNPAGRWLRCIEGVGAVQAIVTDCQDRLYVYLSPDLPVSLLDVASGESAGQETQLDKVANRFAALPFEVTADGCLNLSGLCLGEPCGQALFDPAGVRLEAKDTSAAKSFAAHGTYVSTALDSRLYRCQWDRVSLSGSMPEGTRVTVFTYSAETELSSAQVAGLSPDVWGTAQTVFAGQLGQGWDCLIRSEGGRYLWLKLEFTSDGSATARIARLVVDFPRISLRRYLPAVFGEEPISADFTDRFLAIFDRGFRTIEHQLDQLARFFDPLSAPAERGRDFLGWLASWIGVVLDRHLPLDRQRRILKQAGKLFPFRGTVCGLRNNLLLYLGLEEAHCLQRRTCGPCTTDEPVRWQPPQLILEHFKLRRWMFLGVGRLGDQARLWGQRIVNRSQLSQEHADGSAQLGVTQLKTAQDPFRDPFHVYSHIFSVFVPGWIEGSPQRRKGLERLIATEKPAHTAHRLIFVKPRFRIGIQSMIGFDSVVGCWPEGVVLNQSRLGKASVLGTGHQGGPTLRVGVDARVGTTALIN